MLESGTIMQIKDKPMTVQFKRHETCAQCGACQHGRKQAMLMEAQRIGDAALGNKVQMHPTEHKRAESGKYASHIVKLEKPCACAQRVEE